MKSKNGLITLLVCIGVVCLGLSLFLSLRSDKNTFAQKPLATLIQNSGKISVFRKNMTVKEILSQKTMLFSFDSVETAADGEATMEFDSGYRLHLPENILVTISGNKDQVNLVLKKGDVQVENFGAEGSLFISKEGSRWSANDYELVYKKRQGDPSLPDTSASADTSSLPTLQTKDGLSPDYIQDMMRSQRQTFFKCYTQLLQKSPGVTGQATLSFIIDKNGKVLQPEIASSNIADAVFKKCLVAALQRMEFKSFTGDPISTVFPLKFE